MLPNRHLAVSLLSLAVCTASCEVTYTAKATERISVPYVPAAAIEVSSRNGGIQILGGEQESNVSVEAWITAGGHSQAEAEDRLEAVKIDCTRQSDQRLIVKAAFPGRRNNDGVRYVIKLPDADGAKLKTSNGSIKVHGIAGLLTIATSNGRIEVEDHTGSIDAETSNGRVTLRDVSGPIRVRTSNGRVDLGLRPESGGPLDVRTSNGQVKLAVGASFRGTMSLRTSNGRVRVDNEAGVRIQSQIERRSGTLVFGEGGEPSKVTSSNGSITVSVRD